MCKSRACQSKALEKLGTVQIDDHIYVGGLICYIYNCVFGLIDPDRNDQRKNRHPASQWTLADWKAGYSVKPVKLFFRKKFCGIRKRIFIKGIGSFSISGENQGRLYQIVAACQIGQFILDQTFLNNIGHRGRGQHTDIGRKFSRSADGSQPVHNILIVIT